MANGLMLSNARRSPMSPGCLRQGHVIRDREFNQVCSWFTTIAEPELICVLPLLPSHMPPLPTCTLFTWCGAICLLLSATYPLAICQPVVGQCLLPFSGHEWFGSLKCEEVSGVVRDRTTQSETGNLTRCVSSFKTSAGIGANLYIFLCSLL